MSKTVSVSAFLARVEEIYSEQPAYKIGGDGSGGKCDCIGLIRGALKRAGISPKNCRGTNQAARKSIRNLHKIKKATDLQLGQVVLKTRDPQDATYPMPEQYFPGHSGYTGDPNNYTHIGVVTGVHPLQITHMTSPSAKKDTRIGNWTYAGDLPWLSADAAPVPTGDTEMTGQAIVDVPNDGTVNVRAAGKTSAKRLATLREGAVVTILNDDGKWCEVKYEATGYIMSKYLKETGDS